jgi:IS605 OrfB family transposase
MARDRRMVEEFIFRDDANQTKATMPLSLIVLPTAELRYYIDPEEVAKIVATARKNGILEPLLVRPISGSDKHEVVAGAKRYRASQILELAEVPVVIRQLSDEDALEIDLGITSLVALSTGEKIANPKGFKGKKAKLRKAQKALIRKEKGSNNRYKARRKVAKVHAEISDARNDFLHKMTTRLVRENQLIAVEDLSVKNMVKNKKLAFSISDASWGELVRQLEYKCDWYGRTFVKIDRWFPSSKRCGHCGYIVDKLPLNIREWDCPKCSTHHDRDINASKNILAAGLAVSAPVTHGGNPQDRAGLSVERT